MKLGAITLFVDNMETMVKFYRDVMKLNIEWDGGCFTGVKTEAGVYFNLCERKGFEAQLSETLGCPKGLNGTMEITFDVPNFSDLEAIQQQFGEEILNTLEASGVDTYGLYRWHLERTLSIIDTLKEKYGPDVVDIVLKRQSLNRREEGNKFAKELRRNSLADIIPFFTGGNNDNIIEKNENQVLIKSTGCLAGRIAYDINRGEMVYALHCNNDMDFVDGFNCKLGCEVIQTLMDGHDCCIHRIYVKD